MREMTFKEYVNQSAFEDWIYEDLCETCNCTIDWDSEKTWIDDNTFTRQTVNKKKKTFKEQQFELKEFDPYLPKYSGRLVITIDKSGWITVKGPTTVRLYEEFVARIYVDRMYGRGINGVGEVYYDIPVSIITDFKRSIVDTPFISFDHVYKSSVKLTDEIDEECIIINTKHIVDVMIYNYINYMEYIYND